MDGYDWVGSAAVDWDELSRLYRIAPLGTPPAAELKTFHSKCMFACFAYSGNELVAPVALSRTAPTVPTCPASSSTQSTRAKA
jgi:hypothetical protein